MTKLGNLNVVGETTLPTPNQIKGDLPLQPEAQLFVQNARTAVEEILDGKSKRKFIVVGPCSIHDTDAAYEYAQRLKNLSEQVKDQILLIMRVYFEKPRTTVGWKGFINDPFLDDSFHIEKGLFLARKFLRSLAELGVPAATEALDPIVPQYMDDLITWTAIGARTTESQTHREMSSGLSTPVGFKNSTDGSITTAINAIKSAQSAHNFLGINLDGQCVVIKTRGNRYGHVVLRGGPQPNFDSVSISMCEAELEKNGLQKNIVVDCSHGNSGKNHKVQPLVLADCIGQIENGNRSIVGLMLESNLFEGSQPLPKDLKTLKRGVSITDACIDWETTEKIILEGYQKLSKVAL